MYDYIVRDPFSLGDVLRQRGDRITGSDAEAIEKEGNLVHSCVRVKRAAPSMAPTRPSAISAPPAAAPDK